MFITDEPVSVHLLLSRVFFSTYKSFLLFLNPSTLVCSQKHGHIKHISYQNVTVVLGCVCGFVRPSEERCPPYSHQAEDTQKPKKGTQSYTGARPQARPSSFRERQRSQSQKDQDTSQQLRERQF